MLYITLVYYRVIYIYVCVYIYILFLVGLPFHTTKIPQSCSYEHATIIVIDHPGKLVQSQYSIIKPLLTFKTSKINLSTMVHLAQVIIMAYIKPAPLRPVPGVTR